MNPYILESLVELAAYAGLLVAVVFWATRKEPMARFTRGSRREPPP